MTESYDIFPKPQATKLTVFSAYSQYQRAAMAGYFVLTGCTVSRSSASAVAVASGTYSNGGIVKTYAGGSLTSISAAASDKQKVALIYIDSTDDTLKIEYGSEQTPSNANNFLENTLPLPPNLGDEDWVILALVRITEDGITDTSFGDPVYATGSVANIRYSGTMAVDGTTITNTNGSISISAPLLLNTILTARGDILYRGSGDSARLAKGEANTILAMGADDPAWTAITEQTVLGRLTGGSTKALSVTELSTLTLSAPLAENTAIILDAALSADGKYSGIVETGTAGATISFGSIVYQAVGTDRWELAKADATATSIHRLGVCVQASTNGNATTVLLYGKVRADAIFPTFTKYAPVFISNATAGYATTTVPTSGVHRAIGYAISDNELDFRPDIRWKTVGSSTGTGSEQTIAHLLGANPTMVSIVPTQTGMETLLVRADSTNIYVTATAKTYTWSAEL